MSEPSNYSYSAGEVGNAYYGANHPMKPHRLVMTHHMVMAYELHKQMEIYVRSLSAYSAHPARTVQ